MALIRPLEEEEMERDLADHVQFFKGPLGVIPNSVRTMAHRAPIARAFTDLNVALFGAKSRREFLQCRSKGTVHLFDILRSSATTVIEI